MRGHEQYESVRLSTGAGGKTSTSIFNAGMSTKAQMAKPHHLQAVFDDPVKNSVFYITLIKAMVENKHEDNEWFWKEFDKEYKSTKQAYEAKVKANKQKRRQYDKGA